MAGLAAVCGAMGCGDPDSTDVKKWAHYWVEREADTSTVDTLHAKLPDSALLDSLGGAWTSEEWLRFWDEVEKEQARRRKEVDTTRQGE